MNPFRSKRDKMLYEEEKAKEVFDSNDIQSVANKLGISSANDDKIKFELNKLKAKKNLWEAIGLTEDDFKKYGII